MAFLIFIIIKSLDILTTIIFLNLGLGIETNPLWYIYRDNFVMIFIISYWFLSIGIILSFILRKYMFYQKIIMAFFIPYFIMLLYTVINNFNLIFI